MKKTGCLAYKDLISITSEDTGSFLCELRKKKGLKQNELAEMIGASNQAVSKWEKGNGFPDLMYQKNLCEVLNITLEELHEGKINVKKRKFERKTCLIIKTIKYLSFIFIPAFIFLLTFFLIHFDSFHIYQIVQNSTSDQFSLLIDGIFIESPYKNILYISSITPRQGSWNNTDEINIDIYNKDKSIYYNNKNSNILVSLDNKESYKDLIIKANVTNKNLDVIEYKGKVDIVNIIPDSDDPINKSRVSTPKYKNTEAIIDTLIDNGFKKVEDNLYIKETKNETLQFFIDENKAVYINNDNSIQKYISIKTPYEYISVLIYQNDNMKTILEKYVYNINEDKLTCNIGACSTVQNTLNIVNEKLIPLIVE